MLWVESHDAEGWERNWKWGRRVPGLGGGNVKGKADWELRHHLSAPEDRPTVLVSHYYSTAMTVDSALLKSLLWFLVWIARHRLCLKDSYHDSEFSFLIYPKQYFIKTIKPTKEQPSKQVLVFLQVLIRKKCQTHLGMFLLNPSHFFNNFVLGLL